MGVPFLEKTPNILQRVPEQLCTKNGKDNILETASLDSVLELGPKSCARNATFHEASQVSLVRSGLYWFRSVRVV